MSDEEWAATGRTPRDADYYAAVAAAEKARGEVRNDSNVINYDRYLPKSERESFRISSAANFNPESEEMLREWTYDKFERFYWRKITRDRALNDYQNKDK